MPSQTENNPTFHFASSVLSCENADYTHTIYQQQNEQLFLDQTLASLNCEYILRSEPDQLKLYSMASELPELINQWDIESNETIWTLYSEEANNEPQKLTLSNTGCLSWNIEAANVEDTSSSLLHQFCPQENIDTNINNTNGSIFNSTTIDNNEPFFRSITTNFFTSTLESEPGFDPINLDKNSSSSSMDTTDIIYISMGTVFIFLVFGILCLCTVWKNKDRESRELFNKKSNKYINSGWEEDKEADLDLHYGQDKNTKESYSRSGLGHGSDIAKGGYDVGQSAVEYGLKVPIKYDNNDTDTDDENNEIQENELGYFMNNSQESYQYERSVDISHGALVDFENNTSNRTVRINLSDISDESTSASSSDEAAEPEIVDLVQHKDKTPTKVNKGGENNRNKWGKFNV